MEGLEEMRSSMEARPVSLDDDGVCQSGCNRLGWDSEDEIHGEKATLCA